MKSNAIAIILAWTMGIIFSVGQTTNGLQKTAASDDISVSLNNTMCSRYWGSIVGGIFYTGGPVNFTTLTAAKNGAYVYAGMINPLDTFDYDKGGGTEYYAGVGQSANLLKDSEGQTVLKATVGGMYDAISRIKEMDDDVINLVLRVEAPNEVVTPYFQIWKWFGTGDDSPETGHFIRSGLIREQKIADRFTVGADLSFGYAGDNCFNTDNGIAYYRAVLSGTFKVNNKLSVTPSFVGQLPGEQDEDRAFVDRARGFYNLALDYKF